MLTIKSARTGQNRTALGSSGSLCVTDKDEPLFAKRKFRVYHEFTANTVIRMVVTSDFYLTYNRIWTGQGACRLRIVSGGTPAGTFTPIATKFCLNTVGGDAPGQAVFSVGGTHTGGTEREVLRADSSTAGGGSGNNDSAISTRYLQSGTYYFECVVTGATQAMWNMEYEEVTNVV
jgi:hypothetical protein